MILTILTYNELFIFANELADASGEILREWFGRRVSIEQKSDLSPVTQADRAVEEKLRLMIAEKFPNHGIVGEEFGNTHENAEYKWVLDPIDGTKSFIAGYPIFTTLIALLHNDIPVIGVIDQPILRERWAAISGQQTLFNNTPLPHLQNQKSLKQAAIATTSTIYFTPSQAEKFGNLSQTSASVTLGGDAYAYSMLVSGRLDVVVDAGMKPYDFCALPPIIEGVGAVISDWVGGKLSLQSDGNIIASASEKLHAEALGFL